MESSFDKVEQEKQVLSPHRGMTQQRKLRMNKRRAEAQRLKEIEKQNQEAKYKAEKELAENTTREKTLKTVVTLFKKAKSKEQRDKTKLFELAEWMRYIECNDMPYPENPPHIHSHYKIWQFFSQYQGLKETLEDVNKYTPIFNLMEEIIKTDCLSLKAQTKANIQIMLDMWRNEVLTKIDYGCFLLIRDMEKTFNRVDFYTMDYEIESDIFKIGMFSFLKHPLSKNQIRELPVIPFPQCYVTISLPQPYNLEPYVLRVMYTKCDYFSDHTNSQKFIDKTKTTDLFAEFKRCQAVKEKIAQEIAEEKLKAEMVNIKLSNEFITLDRSETSSILSIDVKRVETNESLTDSISSEQLVGSKMKLEHKTRPKAAWEVRHSIVDRRSTSNRSVSNRRSLYSNKNGKLSILGLGSQIYGGQDHFQFGLDDVFSTVDSDEKKFKALSNECTFSDTTFQRLSQLSVGEDKITFADLLFNIKDRLKHPHKMKTIRDLVMETELEVNVIKEIRGNGSSTSTIFTKDSLTDLFMQNEEEAHLNFIELTIKQDLYPEELNLRMYHIYSGIYFIDLIIPVPEPCQLKNGDIVHIQNGEYQLKHDTYYHIFYPRFSRCNSECFNVASTEDLKYLIKVDIKMNSDVYWFLEPHPVMWDYSRQIWTNDEVFDIRYYKYDNERSVSCSISKTAPLALSVIRFHELPYKNWNLKSHIEEGNVVITLLLECQNLNIEFGIKQEKLSLLNLEGTDQTVLNNIFGEYFLPEDLVNRIKSVGLDLFPEDDTFYYVGCEHKNYAVEDHTYMSMAMFVRCVEFKSSSWNQAGGWKDIFFQARINDTNMEFKTFRTSNMRAELIQCRDDAETFVEKTYKEIGFVPDIYTLLLKFYGRELSKYSPSVPLILTTYYLLSKTKVLTFSGNLNKSLS